MTNYNAISRLSSIRNRLNDLYNDMVELSTEFVDSGFGVEDVMFKPDCTDIAKINERLDAIEESIQNRAE